MTGAAVLAALAGACLAGVVFDVAQALAARGGARTRGAREADAAGAGSRGAAGPGAPGKGSRGPAGPGAPGDTRPGSREHASGAPPASRLRSPRRSAAALLTVLGRRVGAPAAPPDLESRLAAAGRPLQLVPADVMAIKGGAALAGALLALLLAAGLPGRLVVVALLCAPAAGYLAPDALLARRTRLRGERMAAELADLLDLLRVAVQAGLPTGRALAEVGARHPGLLAAELRSTAVRLELGVPRAEALRELAARCPVEGAAALAAAIARAERHGSPLAGALEALAAEARADQARRLRDAAARAAPKIQLVVALVLVPAVMLLVAAVLVQALVPA